MTSPIKTLFAVVFGVLYWLFGLTMIVAALLPALAETAGRYLIPADPAAGFVLCVTGTVFLFAFREMAAGTAGGNAFLYAGMALAVIFGIVAFLSLLAEGTNLVLFGDGEPWEPAGLLVPMVWLAILPAIGLVTWGRSFLGDLTGI